ncbi:MAG: mechanosensitive ion channel [Butyrivibrio sp.]|nr:mechanosensitive ion channel [Butyrivibrio sp.]
MNGMISASGFWNGDKFKEYLDIAIKWCMTVGKNILIALVVLIVGSKLIKWLVRHIGNSFKKTKMEPIVAKFLVSLIKFALYFIIAIVIIGLLGIPTTSFIAALSAAGLTVGLALQGSLSNFAGGVLILLFKPFKIGDYIKEDSHENEGTVIGIDLFYTKILTFDNKTVVVPNGTLANASLTNYTSEQKRRVDIKVGISYDSDIKLAKSVLLSVIESNEDVLKDEEITVYVDALDDSQITIGTRVWAATENYWSTKWALLEGFKEALDSNGIEIPFNRLSVTIKD